MRDIIVMIHESTRRPDILYADAYDYNTGELLISADLAYILKVKEERGYFFKHMKQTDFNFSPKSIVEKIE